MANIKGKARTGSGQCGIVTLDNGTQLAVSYQTVVGVRPENSKALWTPTKYSPTTSKQRSRYLHTALGYGEDAASDEAFRAAVIAAGWPYGNDARGCGFSK